MRTSVQRWTVGGVLIAALLAALAVGPDSFGPEQLTHILRASWQRDVLLYIRLPRVALAALAGATLSLSGLGLQAAFRNPLAEPTMLGTSAAAVFGTLVALYLSPIHAPVFAFACSLLAAWAATAILARSLRNADITKTLLTGLAISSLCGALSMLVLSLALSKWELGQHMVRWSLGSFEDHTLLEALWLLPLVVIQFYATRHYGRHLDALTLGTEHALALGVDAQRISKRLLLLSALATAMATALVGTIGFVGLIVPNIIRQRARAGHRENTFFVAACGAVIVVGADALSRLCASWGDIRPGAITGIMGAPYLIYLATQLERRGRLSS